MSSTSYPRRQLNRRLGRVAKHALWTLALLALAIVALTVGLSTLAGSLLLAAAACAVRSRRWWRLARRSAIGARSEEQVRVELGRLAREGWRIRNSLRWLGGGDIDHLAIAPGPAGIAFAIETKTRSYTPADIARISAVARWQAQRRSKGRPGTIPILCLAGTRRVERWERGVAVVSVDRLLTLMSRLAGTTPKPRFLR